MARRSGVHLVRYNPDIEQGPGDVLTGDRCLTPMNITIYGWSSSPVVSPRSRALRTPSCREHDDAGEHREGEQGTRWITGVVDRWDVGHDHGHCPRGLDSHERPAGEERARDRADHVRVQARERVDPGKQAPRRGRRGRFARPAPGPPRNPHAAWLA